MKIRTIYFIIFLLICNAGFAQIKIGDEIKIVYSKDKVYEIGGITVSGTQYLDRNVLIMLSGLAVGDKIEVPGEKITNAIKKLWDQGLFEDVRITATKIQGDFIFLDIYLLERPRLSYFYFSPNIRKNEADDIREEIKLVRGDVVTENVIINTKNTIKKYYIEKGFFNVYANVVDKKDTTSSNNVILYLDIKKGKKIKINQINFIGNEQIADTKLKRAFKETKERAIINPFEGLGKFIFNFTKNTFDGDADNEKYVADHFKGKIRLSFLKSSKLIEATFREDIQNLLNKYNEKGFRDAVIISDSVYSYDEKSVNIDIKLKEGNKYYFRNIDWVGNSKFTNEELSRVLAIQKGDIYNQKVLETNISMNMNGLDVSSLYMNDGYLFFNIQPVEVLIENDSIDLEIRISEGKQAIINKVTVSGNTRTKDHVILREVRTKPGQLFSRSDIIRTQRELAQLRYFNQETLNLDYQPNPVDGTVDLEYIVEETSTDQVELSGGWGGGRVVGTLGLSLNNFSLRSVLKKSAWRPIPSGDGQKLSIRFLSNGRYYQSYNLSFTEPWLGGKKPNAFSTTLFHTVQTNGYAQSDSRYGSFKIYGVLFGLGKRLKWPDNWFTLYQSIGIQAYKLDNYPYIFSFSDGNSNNINYNAVLSRNSVDAPLFPRKGSEISLSLELTPPYSLLSNKDYGTLSEQEKYKWLEYHKWKFNTSIYAELARNLVLSARTKFGFLGYYNKDLGHTPFERFYVGGDGLSGYNLDGREIIALRGYSNESLTPRNSTFNKIGGTIYNKYTLELRYPLSLNPMATIYALGFFEGGNAWLSFKNFNPYDIKRSAGVGVRIFLPMFGMLGLDWGYGFDEIYGLPNASGGQFHFSINQSID